LDQTVTRLTGIAARDEILKIKSALTENAKLYLVGGVVRDVISQIDTEDIDLTTDLEAYDVAKLLEAANIRVVPTGLQHGTVMAVINQKHFEITTFRAGKKQNRGTIIDDLSERDFTINAIAFCLKEHKLIDPFNGFEDLHNAILKCVNSATERFKEDPLRVLRAIRFGTAAGRQIDESTANVIPNFSEQLKNVAIERIQKEISKILLSDYAAEAIRDLHKFKLLEIIFPELIPTIGFEQNKFHNQDVFEHSLSVLSACPNDLMLRLAAIYHDIGKVYTLSVDQQGNRHFYDHEKISAQITQESMERLKFSKEQTDTVTCIVKLHMRPLDCGPSGTRRILRDSGEHYLRWRQFKNADRPVVFDDDLLEQLKVRFDQMVQAEFDRQVGSVYSKLAISGDDLIALGMKPGKLMGTILSELKELVIEDPEFNCREKLLEIAKQKIKTQ
jgi:tRNA nucleotidyltransferase (CCA-adding enzyme)